MILHTFYVCLRTLRKAFQINFIFYEKHIRDVARKIRNKEE